MISIFKTTLDTTDEQKVQMQKGSTIIKVGEQESRITLWYVCDPEAELHEETFYVVATGQQLPDTFPGLYVDTVQIGGGETVQHVWHVFFKKRPNVQRGEPVVVPPAGGE